MKLAMPVSPYPTFPRKREKGQTNRFASFTLELECMAFQRSKLRRVHSMHHCCWCMECTLRDFTFDRNQPSSETLRVSGRKIKPITKAIVSSPTGYHMPDKALPAFTLSSVIMNGDNPPIQPALRLCGNATAV